MVGSKRLQGLNRNVLWAAIVAVCVAFGPLIAPAAASDDGPPEGYSVVAPAASGGDRSVGTHVSLALDGEGSPMVAYVVEDLANPGNNTLQFAAWDHAAGRWKPAVAVANVGKIDSNPAMRQVSLARDASTGALGIAYQAAVSVNEPENWVVMLAQSTDGGATWRSEGASRPDRQAQSNTGNPALALANGEIHLAYYQDWQRCVDDACTNAAVWYRTRKGASGAFTDAMVPLLPGTSGNAYGPTALALDATGRPGVAYFLVPEAGSPQQGLSLVFWRPGEASASKVADSNNVQSDIPSLSLAFGGSRPHIAYHLATNPEDPTEELWISSANDGRAWGAPIRIPRDGSDITNVDQAVALTSQGQAAVAANLGAGSGDGQCGGPKLARSTDLVNWTTCSPDAEVGLSVGFAGRYVSLQARPNGRLYLAFQNINESPLLPAGVVLWREPTPLRVTPSQIDFGSQPAGSSTTQVVGVHNEGSPTVAINAVEVDSDAFALSDTCLATGQLKPGASCEVTITFAPQAEGAQSGRLDIATGKGLVTVNLAGTGAPAGQ